MNDEVIHTVFRFIEEALNKGDGVLIHSFNGKHRSFLIVTVYLMRKFS